MTRFTRHPQSRPVPCLVVYLHQANVPSPATSIPSPGDGRNPNQGFTSIGGASVQSLGGMYPHMQAPNFVVQNQMSNSMQLQGMQSQISNSMQLQGMGAAASNPWQSTSLLLSDPQRLPPPMQAPWQQQQQQAVMSQEMTGPQWQPQITSWQQPQQAIMGQYNQGVADQSSIPFMYTSPPQLQPQQSQTAQLQQSQQHVLPQQQQLTAMDIIHAFSQQPPQQTGPVVGLMQAPQQSFHANPHSQSSLMKINNLLQVLQPPQPPWDSSFLPSNSLTPEGALCAPTQLQQQVRVTDTMPQAAPGHSTYPLQSLLFEHQLISAPSQQATYPDISDSDTYGRPQQLQDSSWQGDQSKNVSEQAIHSNPEVQHSVARPVSDIQHQEQCVASASYEEHSEHQPEYYSVEMQQEPDDMQQEQHGGLVMERCRDESDDRQRARERRARSRSRSRSPRRRRYRSGSRGHSRERSSRDAEGRGRETGSGVQRDSGHDDFRNNDGRVDGGRQNGDRELRVDRSRESEREKQQSEFG